MTSENFPLPRALSAPQQKAVLSIQQWLEKYSEKNKNDVFTRHSAGAYSLSKSSLRKIQRNWQEVSKLESLMAGESTKEHSLRLRMGWLALQSCNLGRLAYVNHRIGTLESPFVADKKSWDGLQKYVDATTGHKLSLPKTDLLRKPFIEAIETYTGQPFERPDHAFIGTVGLTAILLAEHRQPYTNRLIVPTPGSAPGSFERWDYDPKI